MFLGKSVWKNVLGLKNKMYKLFSAKTNILTLTSSAVFRLQTGLKIVLVCFHISWGNEVDFKDMMYVSPKILFLDQNFKKLRHCFLDERATITTILISVCHWKTLVLFVFKKKKTWKHIFKTNSELSQNHTEKNLFICQTKQR